MWLVCVGAACVAAWVRNMRAMDGRRGWCGAGRGCDSGRTESSEVAEVNDAFDVDAGDAVADVSDVYAMVVDDGEGRAGQGRGRGCGEEQSELRRVRGGY